MALFWTAHLQRLRDALDAQTDLVRVSSAHSTIKGSSVELVIKQLLQGYLPKMFCVGTGQIANRRNELSPQIDIIVYDAQTFPHLAVNIDSSVIVCTESIAAVVECKYTWGTTRIRQHYKRFAKTEACHYGLFGERGMLAGYFVLLVDAVSDPDVSSLEDSNRFVGVYSIKGNKAWSSPYNETAFTTHTSNALELFLHHIMYDSMHKRVSEVGGLVYTYQVVSGYLGWDAASLSGHSSTPQ